MFWGCAPQQIAEDLKPQELSTVFWALASLGYPVDASTLDVLEARALATLPDSSPHSLSNIAWATAKLRPPPQLEFTGPGSKLLRKLVDQIEAQSTKFNGQGLATVVRAHRDFVLFSPFPHFLAAFRVTAVTLGPWV